MSSEPKCMKCDKPATHKITKIIKGKVYDILLCNEHAQQFSPWIKSGGQSHLIEILHQILKQQEEMLTETGPVCPTCGLTWSAYRKTLLLGCSDCYDAFADVLENDLRKMHGVPSHFFSEHAAGGLPESFPDAAAAIPQHHPDGLEEELMDEHEERDVEEEALEELWGVENGNILLSAEKIRRRLEEAVRTEDFETAARLRDTIRMFESLQPTQEEKCPQCQSSLVVMHGPKGFFLACPQYPACPIAKPLDHPPHQHGAGETH